MADYGDFPVAPIVSAQYCAPCPVELIVSKKGLSLSGGSFDITDADGNVIFKMDGHALSIKHKRVLLDPAGNAILCAKEKLVSMHHRWEVFPAEGGTCEDGSEKNMLFFVKKSKVVQAKTNLDVLFPTNTNDNCPDFHVKGNYFEREATVYQGEQVIAEVKRKYTVGNVLLDKHTFMVAIRPGIDQAFIATLVIIMDAIHED